MLIKTMTSVCLIQSDRLFIVFMLYMSLALIAFVLMHILLHIALVLSKNRISILITSSVHKDWDFYSHPRIVAFEISNNCEEIHCLVKFELSHRR